MSLSSILNTASAGIANSDYRIALANANLANASDTSYSRKSAQLTMVSDSVAVTQATATRAADVYLTRTTISAAAASGRDAAISSASESYDAALGTVAGGDDLSSLLSTFQTSLTSLTSAANTTSAKAAVIYDAGQAASSLRGLSSTIQSLRTQANADIATQVGSINDSLDTIAALNDQIVSTTTAGGDATNLEDQRDAALESLSTAIGVSYYTTADNRVQVYTTAGDLLVGDSANHLAYTASAALDAGATYPGAISGITLRGKDVTTTLTSGAIGGLISLRDTTLPDEQSKLDALASQLMSATNAATNAGTAYPPPSQLTGSVAVSGSDAFSATGSLRVALTSSTGVVSSSTDLDLSSYSTVDQLVAGLNSVPGLSASLSASGKLVLSSTDSSLGIALGDLGVQAGASGVGVSDYFGLNELFTGSSAADIAVNDTLATSAALLPTATLSTSGSLASGDQGLSAGDSSVADALTKALTSSVGFPSAGGFPAQQNSVLGYATGFVASAAALVSDASDQADRSSATYTASQTRLQNLTNVNTDEELANLTLYQQQYQANAQMVSTVRTLFDALIQMMQ